MKNRSGPLSFIFVFVFSYAAQAVEVDDISNYYTSVADSKVALNAEVNRLLGEAAKKTTSCDANEFRQALLGLLTPKGVIDQTFFGGMEIFAEKSALVEKTAISLEDSIYRGTPFERASLVIAGKFFKIGAVFPSMRLNGLVIGTDKLSHFFETGYELYEQNLAGDKLSDARVGQLIDGAIALEEGYLGWEITGIKSYGDINAHLQGAFFWHELLQTNGPWWSCDAGRIQLKKAFDFADFVHEGWSEAINCNEYQEQKGRSSFLDMFRGTPPPYLKTIQENMRTLTIARGQKYQCPMQMEGCDRARARLSVIHPEVARQVLRLVSPACSPAP